MSSHLLMLSLDEEQTKTLRAMRNWWPFLSTKEQVHAIQAVEAAAEGQRPRRADPQAFYTRPFLILLGASPADIGRLERLAKSWGHLKPSQCKQVLLDVEQRHQVPQGR